METDLKSSPGPYGHKYMFMVKSWAKIRDRRIENLPRHASEQGASGVGWGEVEVVEGISEKGHFESGASGLI